MSAPWKGAGAQYEESELGKVFDGRLARRLWAYMRPHARWIVVAIGLACGAAALRIAGPWIARYIIDHFLPTVTSEKRHALNLVCLLYVLVVLGNLGVQVAMGYITARVGQSAIYELRRDILEKLHRLPLRFFDRTPSGRLLTRTTSDVSVLYEMFGQGVVDIFTDVILLLGILLAWLFFDWRLAILLFLTGPLLAITSYNFRIKARTAYRAVRLRVAAMNVYLSEVINGMGTVQSFNRESVCQKRYAQLNLEYSDAQFETVRQYARFFPLVDSISFLAIVCVLAYGAWQVGGVRFHGGKPLTPGDFFLYFQYINWFFMPISSLAERYNVFQAAMASSERIFHLLDEPEEMQDPPAPLPVESLKTSVELRDVWFSYLKKEGVSAVEKKEQEAGSLLYGLANGSEQWVLKGVSLRVKRGETVALVGATGAGKSTVINLVTRLYDVQKGAVLFNDRDVRQYAQDDLRRRMAVVLQDVFLFSGTIEDNIRLGNREITREQVERAARHVNAHTFIEQLPKGYDNEVLERGATLSTGQKQLLAFARAVAFDPDLLILDEATANIDTETEALIQDALAKIMHERTCIIVAHRLSTIQNADRILVFSHGTIHEEGTHQDLLQRDGLYRKLYELQYANLEKS
ncbi:MAG TPA: ABC transporter ATP-binding protein [Candidatus Sumerlaeota bacterium]|nr:ABC transporter ATP-binding protein [Candidatus Sumerlaeota bacterium]